MGAGESNLGLLKEQLVFLTNEPSLHPLLVLIFFFPHHGFYLFTCLSICAGSCVTALMWRSDNNLWELVPSFTV